MSSSPNGSKFLSRSFWIVLYVITGSIALDWFKDFETFVVVAPSTIGGWFGMKFVERWKNGVEK